jgi:toxin-antitoxin system PIN domain toxin
LSGAAAVGLPWPSLLAFVRVKANPRLTERPASVADAWRQVEAWLDSPVAWTPAPGPNHRQILARLILGQPLNANLVPDAHLAALAVEHGLTLCSTDGDFARFPGLHWANPL